MHRLGKSPLRRAVRAVTELDRIEPGDPDRSYLVQKIRGDTGIVGHRMPPTPLSADRIELIERWVAEGAPR